MIDEPPRPFLVTLRNIANGPNRPDQAQHHEQIARVIGVLTTGSPSSSDNRRI